MMKSVKEKIKIALENVDDAISLLREVAREDRKYAPLLEDTIYYLEEAGEALNEVLEQEADEN